MLASGVLVALALFPGLPTVPFLTLGGGLGVIAWQKRRKRDAGVKSSSDLSGKPAKENVEALLQVDPLAVEVGLSLVKLVEGGPTSPLLQRIAGIRKNLATQLGYYLPPVKVNDNLALRPREYCILIKGVEIARYELPGGCELAIPSGGVDGSVEGKPTKDPAFGLAALWIPPSAPHSHAAAVTRWWTTSASWARTSPNWFANTLTNFSAGRTQKPSATGWLRATPRRSEEHTSEL